jgi:hypothetical protein
MAGLGSLPDTILSRSVIVRMRRRHTGERVEPFRERTCRPEGAAVRVLIEHWIAEHHHDIEERMQGDGPELPLTDRDADVWERLVAIADAVGGDWPDRTRAAAVALVADAKDTEPSIGVRLLGDLRTAFGSALEMSTKSILHALIDMSEAPWGDMRGKPLDERGLARRLAAYGIRSRNLRIADVVVKGYRRTDLHDAWLRYLPASPDKSATSATSATNQVLEAEVNARVADVADVAPLAGDGGVDPDGYTFNLDDCADSQPAVD